MKYTLFYCAYKLFDFSKREQDSASGWFICRTTNTKICDLRCKGCHTIICIMSTLNAFPKRCKLGRKHKKWLFPADYLIFKSDAHLMKKSYLKTYSTEEQNGWLERLELMGLSIKNAENLRLSSCENSWLIVDWERSIVCSNIVMKK